MDFRVTHFKFSCIIYIILSGKASNFGLKSLHGNRGFGYFDIGSIMEYGIMVSHLYTALYHFVCFLSNFCFLNKITQKISNDFNS